MSRRALIALAMALAPIGVSAATASAADREAGRAILRERDQRQRPRSEEYLGEVIVISKDGRERRKLWRSFRSGPPATYDRLIRFLSPPDVRGVGYLAHFRPGKNPDEWLYLPSMKRERRISARDREGAFAGTSFSYEDLDLFEIDESRYDAALLSSTATGGTPVHLIELIPRTASAYSRKLLTIRSADLALLTVEFFVGRDQAPAKRLTFSGHTEISGYRRPTRVEMVDIRRGGRTIVNLRDIVLDRDQPSDRYTIQNLLREDDAPAPRPVRPSARRQDGGARRAAPDNSEFRLPGRFSGFAEGRSFGFFGDRADRDATAWGTLQLRETLHIGSATFSAAARLESASSSQVGPVIFDPADRDPSRSAISVRELSLRVPLRAGVDLLAGRFQTSWGQTDGFSPSDAFLPRDLSDPLTEDRLPVWGVSLRGERGGVRFELLSVPVTTPWRLPELAGRQSPFTAVSVRVEERPWDVPVRGFEMARVAGRWGAWDVSAWARSGMRPAPVLDPDLDAAVAENGVLVVPLSRRFATEHGGGGSFSRAIGGWIVHNEFAVLHSPDEAVGDAAIWTFGGSRIVRDGTITATIAVNAIDPPVNPLLIFDRALLPCAIVATREIESWGSWYVVWLATFRTVGGVLSAEITRDLTDTLKATIGTDLPHGAALSPATAFSGGQRVRAGVRWSW